MIKHENKISFSFSDGPLWPVRDRGWGVGGHSHPLYSPSPAEQAPLTLNELVYCSLVSGTHVRLGGNQTVGGRLRSNGLLL